MCLHRYVCVFLLVQLETKLKEKIDPSLVEKVDFSQEQESFHRYMKTQSYLYLLC